MRNPNTEISYLDNCLLDSFQVFSFANLTGILDTSGCEGSKQKDKTNRNESKPVFFGIYQFIGDGNNKKAHWMVSHGV